MELIYITGIDGCGKTTQSKLLTSYLNGKGIKTKYQWLRWSPSIVKLISTFRKAKERPIESKESMVVADDNEIQTKENDSYGNWSKYKRRLFKSRLFRSMWITYASWDYYIAYKKASKVWSEDAIVLDRYYFDFIVDQSLNFSEEIEAFENRVKETVLGKMIRPEVFIVIDIEPEIGWERKRDGTSLKHLQKLHLAYTSVRNRPNVYSVDGTQTVDEIQRDIRAIVSKVIG